MVLGKYYNYKHFCLHDSYKEIYMVKGIYMTSLSEGL